MDANETTAEEEEDTTAGLDLGLGPPVALTRSQGTGTELPVLLRSGGSDTGTYTHTSDLAADYAEQDHDRSKGQKDQDVQFVTETEVSDGRGTKRSRAEAEQEAKDAAAMAAISRGIAQVEESPFDFFSWRDGEMPSASLSGGLSSSGRDDFTGNHTKKRRNMGNSTASESDDDSDSDTNYKSVEQQRNSKHLRGLYEITAYLGHGAYGHVYSAKCKRTGDKVAIKRIVGIWDDLVHAKRLLRELRILRELNQPNIIGRFSSPVWTTPLCLMMLLCFLL
jgi:hypothetical protein